MLQSSASAMMLNFCLINCGVVKKPAAWTETEDYCVWCCWLKKAGKLNLPLNPVHRFA